MRGLLYKYRRELRSLNVKLSLVMGYLLVMLEDPVTRIIGAIIILGGFVTIASGLFYFLVDIWYDVFRKYFTKTAPKRPKWTKDPMFKDIDNVEGTMLAGEQYYLWLRRIQEDNDWARIIDDALKKKP